MDSFLTWASTLPIFPKVLVSFLIVGLAIFSLVVLWTPRTTEGATKGQPLSAQLLENSPGAIQAGGDVVITSGVERATLGRTECDALADLLGRGRAAMDSLVAQRASEEARAVAAAVQNETRDWLGQHLGKAHAEAYMSADPSQLVPANYPSQYGGIYQRMRGRLTYLTGLTSQVCR